MLSLSEGSINEMYSCLNVFYFCYAITLVLLLLFGVSYQFHSRFNVSHKSYT